MLIKYINIKYTIKGSDTLYKIKPLDLNSLKPVLSSETLYHHYQKHQNYLNKLNELLIKNNYDFRYSLEELVNHIDIFPLEDRGDILFNLGGVLNHNLYWDSVSDTNHKPYGKVLNKIEEQYETFDNFKKEFINKANKLVGSGYTFLVLDKNNDLNIINLSNQETPYSYNFRPIMTIDMWEHAYYLDYYSKKQEYINNFFSILDFDKINSNYEKEIQ